MNSNTDLTKINKTRANYTVEAGDFLVSEGNIDGQTYTHHSAYFKQNYLQLKAPQVSRLWSENALVL